MGGRAGLREVCLASMAESFSLRFCNTYASRMSEFVSAHSCSVEWQ